MLNVNWSKSGSSSDVSSSSLLSWPPARMTTSLLLHLCVFYHPAMLTRTWPIYKTLLGFLPLSSEVIFPLNVWEEWSAAGWQLERSTSDNLVIFSESPTIFLSIKHLTTWILLIHIWCMLIFFSSSARPSPTSHWSPICKVLVEILRLFIHIWWENLSLAFQCAVGVLTRKNI